MGKKVFIALRMAGIAGQEKLSGIFRFLGENHDWAIRLVRTAGEFTVAAVKDALRSKYDGFIVSIPGTEESAAVLAATDIPTIVMDIHSPLLSERKRHIIFIRNSSEEIGRAAANHLLAIGTCRSYAFVHNPSVMQWSIDRCKAFRKTLRDNGFWCHELKSPEGLEKLERPVGVFAANDDRGYDVIEFCHARRLRVPEDIAVLGINNDTLSCENCRPRLSSIQPDFE
jgi:LacI family transcriptional regulator